MVWADDGKGTRTQGLVYGVEAGSGGSAGYLLAQGDLAAGRSFHGMTLREVDLPVAQSMTVDLIPGEGASDAQYLLLWHFAGGSAGAPGVGELPPLGALPDGYHEIA